MVAVAVDRGRVGVEEVYLTILSFTTGVSSNCPRILRDLVSLYPISWRTFSPSVDRSSATYSVMEYGRKGKDLSYRLYEAGHEVCVLGSASGATAYLESLVNSAAMASLARYLLVHAGVVAAEGSGLLLPAASGAGKSTLVAALSLSGFSYLSDEVGVLDGGLPAVLPFLKAICLKQGGWQVLRTSFGAPRPLHTANRSDGEVAHYVAAPHPFSPEGHIQVRYVLLPERRPGASASLTPVSRATALVELARNSLNLPRHGRAGMETLARLVEGAEGYRLIYHDLREAVAAVSTLVGHNPLSHESLRVAWETSPATIDAACEMR